MGSQARLRLPLTNQVNSARHLFKLLWADVGTEGEAKVEQGKSAAQVLVCEWLAVLIKQLEGAADGSFAHYSGLLALQTCMRKDPSCRRWADSFCANAAAHFCKVSTLQLLLPHMIVVPEDATPCGGGQAQADQVHRLQGARESEAHWVRGLQMQGSGKLHPFGNTAPAGCGKMSEKCSLTSIRCWVCLEW